MDDKASGPLKEEDGLKRGLDNAGLKCMNTQSNRGHLVMAFPIINASTLFHQYVICKGMSTK